MNDTSTVATAPPPPRAPLVRIRQGAIAGGVCVGVARHLGWSVTLVRIAFVVLGLMNLLGVWIYAALWLWVRRDTDPEPASTSTPRRLNPVVVATSVLAGGTVLWLMNTVTGEMGTKLFAPVMMACVGVAILWRQADREPGERQPRWSAAVRIVGGIGMLLVAAGILLPRVGVESLPEVLAMSTLAIIGVALIVAPWVLRLARGLTAAREEKAVAEARAEMAAHLHDSVLQTLALIQRHASDSKHVSQLARRQERELRTWLYGQAPEASTFLAGLTTAAGEVEDDRQVRVEVITVGDCVMTPAIEAIVAAAREAMVNAAKHSGQTHIDVYAEASDDVVEVFVRDRGIGFRLDDVAADRLGIQRSIVERMARHGGTAEVRSAPGHGTEVRLEMPR